jgi:hypothetical protein
MYACIQGNEGQLSTEQQGTGLGKCFTTRTKQMMKERQNSEHECCTKKQKRPPPIYHNPWLVAINNFFAPLRDLPMANVETSSKENSNETPGTNESIGKGRPPPIVLTSEANLIGLQRELSSVVSSEFFFTYTAIKS